MQQAPPQPEPARGPAGAHLGEETPATFDQHRKLKSHADEYLLKPIDDQDLLVKVGGFLKLDLGPGAGDDDEVHELDADSDIVLADDDDIDS